MKKSRHESSEETPDIVVGPNQADRSSQSYSRSSIVLGCFVLLFVGITLFLVFKPSTTNNNVVTSAASASPLLAISPAVVSITKTGFTPTTVSVKVGQAVQWVNNDTSPHLVASDPYPSDNTLAGLNSQQAVAPDDSYTYVFSKTGTYTYHDDLNPYSLKGTVIVR